MLILGPSFSQGRDIIEISDNIPRLLHIAHTLAQVDLGVTLRASHDTFKESASAAMITWLLDLCTSSVASSPTALRKVIASEMLSPRDPQSDRQRPRQKAGLDRFKDTSFVPLVDSTGAWSFKKTIASRVGSFGKDGGVAGSGRDDPLDTGSVGSGALSRLDWLLVYHTKLWKKPRAEFQQLFTKVTMADDQTRFSLGESKVFPSLSTRPT